MAKVSSQMERLADVEWHGDSREVLRGFPEAVKDDLGYALEQLQRGQVPAHSKAMPGVGKGVYELYTQDERAWYRVIYCRKAKVIHILHCFEKRTKKTARQDIETARQRLKEI